jgi:glyoxylate carboligase
MLGMHGTYEANMAMHDCDVMICLGARFDDRITGRTDAFSPGSKKIHVDIDPSSINKTIKVEHPDRRRCRHRDGADDPVLEGAQGQARQGGAEKLVGRD